MRHANLIEETATYDDGTTAFTPTGITPGARPFAAAGFISNERMNYRASSGADWEIGVGQWDGSGIVRVAVLASSDSGAAINFTEEVTLTVVQLAGSMLMIDSGENESASAHGDGAMAAGVSAECWGEDAMALGDNAQVGSESTPNQRAMALGPATQALHEGAVALGYNARSAIPYARHGRSSFDWSGETYTSNATPTNITGPNSAAIDLPEYTTIAVRAIVLAQRGSDGAAYSAEIVACIRRTTGNAALIGSATTVEIAKTGGVTATATIVAGPSGLVAVQVTGVSSEGWAWAASVQGVFVWP